MKRPTFIIILLLFLYLLPANAQPCMPLGNQNTYGTGNVWKGYLYSNQNLTTYCGYINQGTAGSPDFDQNFGGSNIMFATNGCPVQTETFSARYRLTKNFSNGVYDFTVGGDDGYRLSLDGGVTWAIDGWSDHSYASTIYSVALNGTYNLVLEYYENSGDNRISFAVSLSCAGTENTAEYGTGNVWKGYVYDDANFTFYKGMVLQGSASDASFDQDFGGSNVNYATSGCSVETETFSVRYRLKRSFTTGIYLFTVAGDDGYRLSLDGGVSWIINKWSVQSLLTTVLSLALTGNYNMVIEYYENSGENRVSFTSIPLIVLPVNLLSFTGKEEDGKAVFDWRSSSNSHAASYELEKSKNGNSFSSVAIIPGSNGRAGNDGMTYHYTDAVEEGKWYYRLKIKDTNGNITYSNIVILSFSVSPPELLSVFPTLLTGKSFSIRSATLLANARIDILDISGKKMIPTQVLHIEPGQTTSFSLPQSLQAGLYIVQVERPGGRVFVQKILAN